MLGFAVCQEKLLGRVVSAIMDSFDCEKVHFEFTTWSGVLGSEENSTGSFSLLQSLRELRVRKGGKEKAYKEMLAVLGGNLKRFLQ